MKNEEICPANFNSIEKRPGRALAKTEKRLQVLAKWITWEW